MKLEPYNQKRYLSNKIAYGIILSIIAIILSIAGRSGSPLPLVPSENTFKDYSPNLNNGEHIIKGDTFGCTNENTFKRLINYSNDNIAFKKVLIQELDKGVCDYFKQGEKIYLGSMVSNNSLLSLSISLISVRRKGSIKEYWIYPTNIE